jgi:nucleotide-binding universal stress UspA family protein
MSLFTNILVAIDGSAASERAFARAVDEARIWNARLHVVYVVETGLFASLPADNTVELMYQVLEKEGKEDLNKAKIAAAAKGVTTITHMKQGHAGSEIVSLATHEKIDLIVVGSHGKSQADRILIGSVSTFVITHGTVTTMVVRS